LAPEGGYPLRLATLIGSNDHHLAITSHIVMHGDKPALYVHSREVAHREGPGLIDLRLTAAGWGKVKAIFVGDEAIERTPTRRDWVALRIQSPADVERLRPLLSAAVEGNR